MDVKVIPEQPIPAKVIIRIPEAELVTLLVRAATSRGYTVRNGKCLLMSMDYTTGSCVTEVTLAQPAEPAGD